MLSAASSKHDVDIIIVDNASDTGDRSLKANTIDSIKSKHFSNVTVVKNEHYIRTHGTALDLAVRSFGNEYDCLLCWESDISVFANDSVDWVASFLSSSDWMVGYDQRDFKGSKNYPTWYIMPNPGIYNLEILKEIDEIVRTTVQPFYFGQNYSKTKDIELKYEFGVFSEQRGFNEISDRCPDGIGNLAREFCVNSDDVYGLYENGQWLFFYMLRNSNMNYKSLYNNRVLKELNGELAPAYTEFGDGLFKHYWAGTRSWDFLTRTETNISQLNYIQHKITTEINLWKQLVPINIRKCVRDVYNSCRNDEYEVSNLRYVYDNKLGTRHSQKVSLDLSNWYKQEFLETDFGNLL